MILKNPIRGKNICLRSALPDDAEFILNLRLDDQLGKYLHPTDPSVEKQRVWIEEKIKASDDYHLIIEDFDDKALGVMAVYEIKDKTFNVGRWIISKIAPKYVAFESLKLAYFFAFETLGLDKALFDTMKTNKKALFFHESCGARRIKEDNQNIYFEFDKNDYQRRFGER